VRSPTGFSGHIALEIARPNLGESAVDTVEVGVGKFLEGMLPEADDFPSLAAELADDATIAGDLPSSEEELKAPSSDWAQSKA